MNDQKMMPVGELFKKSFDLYKPRIWTMLALSSICGVVSTIIGGVSFGIGFVLFALDKGVTTNLVAILVCLSGFLLIITVNAWVHVALMYTVKEENKNMGVKNILATTKNQIASYYWIALLNGIIIMAGFIFFIIPGIIFSVWYNFSQYFFVFESVRGTAALEKSRQLVKGYWWPVFGRILLLGIVAFLISSLSKIGFVINILFTMPFGIAYFYVIYEDLKKIKSV